MALLLKRAVAPVMRLTTVEKVAHEATFEEFARKLTGAVVDHRIRDMPRVVSFPLRRAL